MYYKQYYHLVNIDYQRKKLELTYSSMDSFLKFKLKLLRKHVPLLKANNKLHFKQTFGSFEQLTQLVSAHFTQVPLLANEYPKLVLHYLKHCPSFSLYPV